MKARLFGIKPLAKYSGAWDEGVAQVMGRMLSETENIVKVEVS
jgi:hypothetical protein